VFVLYCISRVRHKIPFHYLLNRTKPSSLGNTLLPNDALNSVSLLLIKYIVMVLTGMYLLSHN